MLKYEENITDSDYEDLITVEDNIQVASQVLGDVESIYNVYGSIANPTEIETRLTEQAINIVTRELEPINIGKVALESEGGILNKIKSIIQGIKDFIKKTTQWLLSIVGIGSGSDSSEDTSKSTKEVESVVNDIKDNEKQIKAASNDGVVINNSRAIAILKRLSPKFNRNTLSRVLKSHFNNLELTEMFASALVAQVSELNKFSGLLNSDPSSLVAEDIAYSIGSFDKMVRNRFSKDNEKFLKKSYLESISVDDSLKSFVNFSDPFTNGAVIARIPKVVEGAKKEYINLMFDYEIGRGVVEPNDRKEFELKDIIGTNDVEALKSILISDRKRLVPSIVRKSNELFEQVKILSKVVEKSTSSAKGDQSVLVKLSLISDLNRMVTKNAVVLKYIRQALIKDYKDILTIAEVVIDESKKHTAK